MKDVVTFWSDLIETFNDENRCGYCWNFYAPLREIDLNVIRNNDECCVNVFILRNKAVDFDFVMSQDTNLHFTNATAQRDMHDIYFLIKSKEGINNYNEIPDHNISESRHEQIFKPLRECIKMDMITELCEKFMITNVTGRYVYDYQDEQYYGIQLTITHYVNT